MGRPKKEDGTAKNKRLQFRVSQADIDELKRVSEWAKMSPSETLRTLIHEAKNYYIRDSKN